MSPERKRLKRQGTWIYGSPMGKGPLPRATAVGRFYQHGEVCQIVTLHARVVNPASSVFIVVCGPYISSDISYELRNPFWPIPHADLDLESDPDPRGRPPSTDRRMEASIVVERHQLRAMTVPYPSELPITIPQSFH